MVTEAHDLNSYRLLRGPWRSMLMLCALFMEGVVRSWAEDGFSHPSSLYSVKEEMDANVLKLFYIHAVLHFSKLIHESKCIFGSDVMLCWIGQLWDYCAINLWPWKANHFITWLPKTDFRVLLWCPLCNTYILSIMCYWLTEYYWVVVSF